MSEVEKRSLDTVSARRECERGSANLIECKVPRRNIYNKRELNSQPNETTVDSHDHLWGTCMKTLTDYLIEEIGEQWKFGCLSEMCCNSPCQLFALTPEKNSERMVSVANLLDTHSFGSG